MRSFGFGLIRALPNIKTVIGLGAVLRVIDVLRVESLWYDESFTAWLAKLDFSQMLRAIAGDVHPPLYYALTWITSRVIGTSETALRLPSMLAGIAVIWLVWQVARALNLGRGVALAAAGVAAVMPSLLYYSGEARMYTLLTAAVLTALLGVLKGRWLWFVAGAVVTVYTQNLGVLYVAAIGAVWFLQKPRRAIAPLITVAIAYVPAGLLMLSQSQDVGNGFWLQPLTPGGFFVPFAAAMGWRWDDALTIPAYGAALGATLIGLISAGPRLLKSDEGRVFLAAAFGPPLMLAVISMIWRPIYLPRALLPTNALLAVLWAVCMMGLAHPAARRAARWVMIPVLVAGVATHYFPAAGARDDIRAFTAVVRNSWQDGDIVYYPAIHSAVLFGYYLPDKPYLLRPYASDLNQSLTESTKAEMGFSIGGLWEARSAGRRVWVVSYTNPMTASDELAEIQVIRADSYATVEKGNEWASMGIYLLRKVDTEVKQ